MNADHLFVSYATENSALAEWVTRKLTAEGYRVWCDRFKLLGGESYPRDIDAAIKQGTFRVLALLSRHSIQKANPVKERTLALSIGRERKIPDFLIPLNVDGLKATELDWMMSDITYIPFNGSWASGLKQLLEKLQSVGAPRPLEDGKTIAANTFLSEIATSTQSELIYTNCLPVLKIPEALLGFQFLPGVPFSERKDILTRWPVYFISESVGLSFDLPREGALKGRQVSLIDEIRRNSRRDIFGVSVSAITTFLLKASILTRGYKLGLKLNPNEKSLYFPSGLLEGNRLRYVNFDGKKTSLLVSGERKLWRPQKVEQYRYHLATEVKVRRDLGPVYIVQILPTVYVTPSDKESFSDRGAAARRKHLTKTWTNRHWLNRILAVVQFLAHDQDSIQWGDSENRLVSTSSKLNTVFAPSGINEAALHSNESEVDDASDEIQDESDEFADDEED
jgi:TIR domain-containing protein